MRQHNEVDSYSGPEQEEINSYLRARHGECFMGFPTYRLVLSSYVTILSAGEWNDWDENIPFELRGRLVADATGQGLTPESCSERRVIEMRRIEAYPELTDIHGWILERWMSPAYGPSPAEWNSKVVPGTDIPALGPFPYLGYYIHIAGPYSEAPTGPFLDRLIEQWEMMREDVLAMATDAYVRKRWYDANERDKRKSEKWNREASAANMTALQPFFSTFLEGGQARQRAAEHAGIQSNYGN